MTMFTLFFFFNDTATTEIYTLSLHDALPISGSSRPGRAHQHSADGQAARQKALRCFAGITLWPGPAQDSRSGARDPRSHSGFLAGGEGGRETLVVDARECRSAGAPSSACDLAPGGTCLGGCPTVTLLIPDRSVREAGGVFLPVRFCGRLFSKQELELIREIARDYAGLGITEIARTVCELLDWTRANGRLKDQECRRLLERLRDQGWLTLPPVRNSGPQGPRRIRLSEASAP